MPVKRSCISRYFCLLLLIIFLTFLSSDSARSFHKSLRKNNRIKKDVHGTEHLSHLEAMFREHAYELSIRPNIKGEATKVGLRVVVESITDVSEKNMDFTVTFVLYETWTDSRLKFRSSSPNDSLVLPSRLIDKIWVPDLYVVGAKSSFIHKTTVNNVVLRLYSNGNIFYKVKITSTVACLMDLSYFPFDVEECSLTFRSLGYTAEELTLEWVGTKHMSSLFMNQALVKNMPTFEAHHCNVLTQNISFSNVLLFKDLKKSQVELVIELKRYPISFILQSYFPAVAMVCIAGMGMLIDPKCAAARVALGVMSLLTIATIIAGLKSTLPKVSYLTAMDIYLLICFIFVFLTVLQFCLLNHFMLKKTDQQDPKNEQRTLTTMKWKRFRKILCIPEDFTEVDKFCGIGYVAGFFLVNVAYFCVVLYLSSHADETKED